MANLTLVSTSQHHWPVDSAPVQKERGVGSVDVRDGVFTHGGVGVDGAPATAHNVNRRCGVPAVARALRARLLRGGR